MRFLYFLVENSPSWDNLYHENFFVAGGGFLRGFFIALICGLVLSLIFYLLCNLKNTVKFANIWIWVAFMVAAGGLSYVSSNVGVIGLPNSSQDTVFYEKSFYATNEQYYLKQTQDKQNRNQQEKLLNKKTEIKQDLDNNKDVRIAFCVTSAVLALVFYIIFSLFFKNFSLHGKAIPCQLRNVNKKK